MQVELLKNIITYVAGQNAVEIVDLLHGKQNVNEFLIAKKMDLTINQARNILYKLSDEGLVSFIRKKDKKNGGWYTYFWTLDMTKALHALRKRILQDIQNLEHQLTSKQTKQFYYCPNCDVEMSEENALLHDFTCPECGEIFELKDNAEHITHIEERITQLKERLTVVDEEIAKLDKKHEAAKERKRKAEEKKKKEEREARRKERERLKKKEEKKKGKKPAPKKKAAKTTRSRSTKKTTAKKTTKKPTAKKKTTKKTPARSKTKKTTKKKTTSKKPTKKTNKKTSVKKPVRRKKK